MLSICVIFIFSGLFTNINTTFAKCGETGEKPCPVKKAVENTNYHITDNPTVNVTDFGDFTPVQTIGEFATKIITFLMQILGGIAMLGIVAGGIMIMGGGFSEETMENGKTLLLYSVIGVGIAMLSMVIVTLAQSFLYSFGK